MNRDVHPDKLAKLGQLESIRSMIGPSPTLEQYNDAPTKAAAGVLAKIARAHLLLEQLTQEVIASDKHQWSSHAAMEVVTLVNSILLSRKQIKNASQPRAVDSSQRERLLRRYDEMVASGERHGAIKALAREYNVHSNTIHNYINSRAKTRNAQ